MNVRFIILTSISTNSENLVKIRLVHFEIFCGICWIFFLIFLTHAVAAPDFCPGVANGGEAS